MSCCRETCSFLRVSWSDLPTRYSRTGRARSAGSAATATRQTISNSYCTGSLPLVPGFDTFFSADTIGSVVVNGPAANFEGLDESFSFPATTTVTTQILVDEGNRPEQLPRASIARDLLTGNVFGLPRRDLVLRYGGRVDGVRISQASGGPFNIPLPGREVSFASENFVASKLRYTPIPEPASLLLLGSALAAAALKGKQALATRRRRVALHREE